MAVCLCTPPPGSPKHTYLVVLAQLGPKRDARTNGSVKLRLDVVHFHGKERIVIFSEIQGELLARGRQLLSELPSGTGDVRMISVTYARKAQPRLRPQIFDEELYTRSYDATRKAAWTRAHSTTDLGLQACSAIGDPSPVRAVPHSHHNARSTRNARTHPLTERLPHIDCDGDVKLTSHCALNSKCPNPHSDRGHSPP